MYWLARPPYLRWLAAAAILLVGFLFEMTGRTTVDHPFTARAVTAGTELSPDLVDWRPVPPGLFGSSSQVEAGIAAVDIPAGTPIVSALVSQESPIPSDWWAVPMAVPLGVGRGADVQIAIASTGLLVPGTVLEPATETGFGFEETGLVAVPGHHVAAVASAVAASDTVVAVSVGR